MNIHLIKTDKPSRLHITGTLNLYPNGILRKPQGLCKNQHIYITNNEEIKLNDYVIQVNFEKTNTQVIRCETEFQVKIANDKNGSFTKNKIILTDNKDLIKDGVQEIDDKFLEWFVKNPSCEKVEVEDNCLEIRVCDCVMNENCLKPGYKIIIPKEEPKPHSFCETPEEKCAMNYCDENGCQNRKKNLVEEPNLSSLELKLDEVLSKETEESLTTWLQEKRSKQETAVEFLKKEYIKRGDCLPSGVFKDALEMEAKQDQNKYSEEDMREAIKFGLNGMYGYQFDEEGETENQISKYLQQFKKK